MYFLEKTQIIFQEAPAFEIFSDFWSKNAIWIHFYRNLSKWEIFENYRIFSQKYSSTIPNISISWTFWDFLSSITTWGASWKEDAKLTNFPKNQTSFINKPIFFRTPKFWTFARFLSNKTIWEQFSKKVAKFRAPENFQDLSRKKASNCFRKLQLLIVLRLLQQIYHLKRILNKRNRPR